MSVSTTPALPKSCFYEHASTVVPSRKHEYRASPTGSTEFTSAGQVCRLTLPQLPKTVYNHQTGYLFFQVDYTHAGIADTAMGFLLGSPYSCWARQVIKQNSQVLETIENPSIAHNMVTNMTINVSDKFGLSTTFGSINGDSNCFGVINSAIYNGVGGTGLSYTFAIPLIGILNCAKMCPAWLGSTEIELTTNALANYIAEATGDIKTSFKISNVEYSVECLELSEESYQLLLKMNELANFNQIIDKSQSFSYGSASLPNNQGVGTIDIPFTVKVGSLKAVLWSCSPANAIDKNYAGVNPNLENWQFICNGTVYPQSPIRAKYPAEAFMQNQKSWGSVYSASHSGSASKNEFCVASTAYGTPNFYRAYSSGANPAVGTITGTGNKFYQMIDLEKVNGSDVSYTGISTNGTSSTIRLNINTALAAQTHNIQYYGYYDVIIMFDLINNQVMVSSG